MPDLAVKGRGREDRVLHPFLANIKYRLVSMESLSPADAQVTNCNSNTSAKLKGIFVFHLFLLINYAAPS